MAKQLVNVGTSPNDGTGDTLRAAGQKINSMFNEVYNNLGDGSNIKIDIDTTSNIGYVLRSNGTTFIGAPLSYTDLINRPTIPNAQVNSDWNATSGIAQILNRPLLAAVATSGDYNDLTNRPSLFSGSYNDLTNRPILSTVATSGNYNDLTNKPSIPEAQVNTDWNASSGVQQILNKPNLSAVATTGSYADLLNKPTLFSGSYTDLTNKPNVPTTLDTLTDVVVLSPTTGQVLKFDGTNWVNDTDISGGGSGGSSLQSRGTVSVSTGSLTNNSSIDLGLIGYKSYALLKIETSHAAWVTVYTSTASRTADAGRTDTTDPLPGSGVIAEVITTGAYTQVITPAAIGFNDDSTPSENIYLKVVNKSGSTQNITVTLTVLQLEA
jgi:hypothetical protein